MAKNNKRCKPLKQSKYEVVEVGATEKIIEIGAQKQYIIIKNKVDDRIIAIM